MRSQRRPGDQHADSEAHTRREHHGSGVLTLLDGVRISAACCLLPDGAVTGAECSLPHLKVDDAQRVWARRLPGTLWHCSWRHAASVLAELSALGWELAEAEPPQG